MANYPLIFGATLIVNVIVTLRSSGLYERFFKKTNGHPPKTATRRRHC